MSCDRSYEETIEYLYDLQKHGIKLSLSNSCKLMEMLGDPHRKFRSVHVAGTNGKGSTSAFIAQMLQSAGYRVGLYTSPHLISFTERIRINNVQISERDVVLLAQRVRDAACWAMAATDVSPLNPTFFEVTTAIAFAYFAEKKVDIAVIETGMGGRFDATNVLLPLVSVITNIDLEHTEFLGNTLEQISAEKAGIIKAGVPVVTGVVQPEVVGVIERAAAQKGAPLHRLSGDFSSLNITFGQELIFDYQGIRVSYESLCITMLGAYQVDNACLAVAVIECLRNAGIQVDESALRHGLELARWEGRMEQVGSLPDIFLDGAHNPASANKLASTIKQMQSAYQRTILIIGILGDKDFSGIISALVPLVDHVVVTKPQYFRAMDVDLLAAEIRKLHDPVEVTSTLADAVARSAKIAAPDDLILITGSLYLVGEARKLFFPAAAGSDRQGALSGLKG